jgi:hypothetical protein
MMYAIRNVVNGADAVVKVQPVVRHDDLRSLGAAHRQCTWNLTNPTDRLSIKLVVWYIKRTLLVTSTVSTCNLSLNRSPRQTVSLY